jgi:hypothetical protein
MVGYEMMMSKSASLDCEDFPAASTTRRLREEKEVSVRS